jgi:hypothetical protein
MDKVQEPTNTECIHNRQNPLGSHNFFSLEGPMNFVILIGIDQEQCIVVKISSGPKKQTYNRKLRKVMQWIAYLLLSFILYFIRSVTIYILGCKNLTPWPYIPASQLSYNCYSIKLI